VLHTRLALGPQLWQGEIVNAAIAEGTVSKPAGRNAAARFVFESMDRWVKVSGEFAEWQYREIVSGNPTAEQLAEHRDALKWMLRFTRWMQAQVKDPDFPLRQFANEVDGRLLQFEEVWKLIHEPTRMRDDEVDAAIHAAFSDEG
jgi:hypothetical protein